MKAAFVEAMIAAIVLVFIVLKVNGNGLLMFQNAHPFANQLSNTVVVIAHRGNSSEAPENTLAAINEAFALGASMVEVDVHLSADGQPVVIHDDTVDRTTNGKGLVAQMTIDQLKSLDAGSWKNPKYANERIPTLAEALKAAQGKGRLLLDVKVENLGRAIDRVLRDQKLSASSVVVGSWTDSQASEFTRFLPEAQILMTRNAGVPNWKADFFKKQIALGISGFELGANWSKRFIAAAHLHNLSVYAYTINDETAMRKLIEMGIDGIETDVPAVLVRLINDICLKAASVAVC